MQTCSVIPVSTRGLKTRRPRQQKAECNVTVIICFRSDINNSCSCFQQLMWRRERQLKHRNTPASQVRLLYPESETLSCILLSWVPRPLSRGVYFCIVEVLFTVMQQYPAGSVRSWRCPPVIPMATPGCTFHASSGWNLTAC